MSQIKTSRDLLIALQRMEFERAATLDLQQLVLQGIALVLAVAAFFLPDEQWAWFISPVSIVPVLWAFWLIHRSRESRSLAEKARRVTVLVDGLGFRLSASELRRFEALSGVTNDELNQWAEPNFFATREVHGVKRAVEIAEENAFWSFHLYRSSARRTQMVLVIAGAVLIACLVLAFSPLIHQSVRCQ
jgi:hypothetical protein